MQLHECDNKKSLSARQTFCCCRSDSWTCEPSETVGANETRLASYLSPLFSSTRWHSAIYLETETSTPMGTKQKSAVRVIFSAPRDEVGVGGEAVARPGQPRSCGLGAKEATSVPTACIFASVS